MVWTQQRELLDKANLGFDVASLRSWCEPLVCPLLTSGGRSLTHHEDSGRKEATQLLPSEDSGLNTSIFDGEINPICPANLEVICRKLDQICLSAGGYSERRYFRALRNEFFGLTRTARRDCGEFDFKSKQPRNFHHQLKSEAGSTRPFLGSSTTV